MYFGNHVLGRILGSLAFQRQLRTIRALLHFRLDRLLVCNCASRAACLTQSSFICRFESLQHKRRISNINLRSCLAIFRAVHTVSSEAISKTVHIIGIHLHVLWRLDLVYILPFERTSSSATIDSPAPCQSLASRSSACFANIRYCLILALNIRLVHFKCTTFMNTGVTDPLLSHNKSCISLYASQTAKLTARLRARSFANQIEPSIATNGPPASTYTLALQKTFRSARRSQCLCLVQCSS